MRFRGVVACGALKWSEIPAQGKLPQEVVVLEVAELVKSCSRFSVRACKAARGSAELHLARGDDWISSTDVLATVKLTAIEVALRWAGGR